MFKTKYFNDVVNKKKDSHHEEHASTFSGKKKSKKGISLSNRPKNGVLRKNEAS
jgi:hypothetical protein